MILRRDMKFRLSDVFFPPFIVAAVLASRFAGQLTLLCLLAAGCSKATSPNGVAPDPQVAASPQLSDSFAKTSPQASGVSADSSGATGSAAGTPTGTAPAPASPISADRDTL